jgi:hypothetical protein
VIARRRTLRLLAVAAASALAVVASSTAPAGAASDEPTNAFQQWVGGSTVSVSGTYTPLVGNFGGGRGDDIFWYAPGPTPDYLWISSTTRGSFTKIAKPVSGTYTPLVGDFGGDRYDDIFWYGSGTAPDSLWTSVDTAAYFSVSSRTVNGVYQPLALDMSLTWPGALASGGWPDTSGAPKDHIVWYRPGPASDLLWQFRNDGSFIQSTLPIEGSPRLIPLNASGDTFEDFLAYSPGSGPDALFVQDTGAYLKTPKSVNGTYDPIPIGGGYFDGIVWHGKGSAPDAYWANSDTEPVPLAPRATAPIASTGTLVPMATERQAALVYDPNGPELRFTNGALTGVLDPPQAAGARPFTGDFDGDLGLDAFFYRPGSGAESIAFSRPPVLWT